MNFFNRTALLISFLVLSVISFLLACYFGRPILGVVIYSLNQIYTKQLERKAVSKNICLNVAFAII